MEGHVDHMFWILAKPIFNILKYSDTVRGYLFQRHMTHELKTLQ